MGARVRTSASVLGRSLVPCLALLALGCLGGCVSQDVATHPADVQALMRDSADPIDGRFQPISQAERARVAIPAPMPYRLGVGDAVHVTVPGQEAFVGFGETSTGQIVGTRVKADGNIYLPVIERVPAEGRTALELQEDIRQRLDAQALRGAFVSVDVVEHRSQRFHVFGRVRAPGAFPVDGRTSLLDAVAKAGGVDLAAGDPTEAYVVRGGRPYPVSLADVMYRAHPAGQMTMAGGDILFVPHRRDEDKVYVLGEVRAPGVVPMKRGAFDPGATSARISLAEALASVGGLDTQNADHDQIRIFRGSWGDLRSFTISAHEIYRYGERILLHPGDRVLVAPSGAADFSRLMDQSLGFVRGATALTALGLTVNSLND